MLLPLMPYCQNTTANCLQHEMLKPTNTQYFKSLIERIRTQNNSIYTMLDEPINFTNQTIHKRGLLDIGGKIGKTLFGLSTMEDIHELHEIISTLQTKMKHDLITNTKFTNSMASLINGTTESLEALSNKIFLNKEALINVSKTMVDWREMK